MPNGVITEADTERMAALRKADLQYSFPELKREDFADENAYREALINQYQAIRQQEYEYVVRNESNRAYNDICEGRTQLGGTAGHENKHIWDSYAGVKLTQPSDSTAIASDIAKGIGLNPKGMCQLPNKDKKTGKVKSTGAYSCAMGATALQSAISSNMGYDGKENIIQIEKNKPYTSAQSMATGVSSQYYQAGKGRTLNQMIASGDIKAGDAVSIKSASGREVNTNSQCHVLTIAAVNKDDTGKITSYTVESYNNCHFININVNDNRHFFGSHTVVNSVKTHQFMDEKITNETQNLRNLSTDELVATVTGARTKVEGVIDELHTTETFSATHRKSPTERCFSGAVVTQYASDLDRLEQKQLIREHGGEMTAEQLAQVMEPKVQEPQVAEAVVEEKPVKQTKKSEAKFKPIELDGNISGLEFPTVEPIKVEPITARIEMPEIPVPELAANDSGKKKKKTKKEMKEQKGELAEKSSDIRMSGTVALKEGPMYKKVEERTAVENLSRTDGRPVFEALRDGQSPTFVPVEDGKQQSAQEQSSGTEKKPTDSKELLAYLSKKEKQNTSEKSSFKFEPVDQRTAEYLRQSRSR